MTEKMITPGVCSGCHSCYSICPKNAISMKPDDEGFLYPSIDSALCVDCGLCQSVCPVNLTQNKSDDTLTAFAAINKDDTVRQNSSSGGVFALLANRIIQLGGVVYGAGFNSRFDVEHMPAETDIRPLLTSKYVQSHIGNSFRNVNNDLHKGRHVLFAGTPCQVAGLQSYLAKLHTDCSKLYLVDLICHGVPSPLVWAKHLSSVSDGKNVSKINFRDKSISWGGFSLNIAFDDGTAYKKQAGKDPYMKGFFANLTLRPSCYRCSQKTVHRVSDLTIADCWGVDQFAPEINDSNGVSSIIVHTPKGDDLLAQISGYMQMQQISIDHILRHNRPLVESVKPHPRRAVFFERLKSADGENVGEIIEAVLKPTFQDRTNLLIVKLKRFGKKILRKNGGCDHVRFQK